MQAYFRMNNDILDLGLSPNEIKVAVCLYSCVFKNNYYVQIKQSTIADRCGIKKTETVSNIICKLQRKGVIEGVSRPHKKDGNLGTYIYKLKSIATRGFFKVKRYILGKLTGIQLRMYLFVCRAIVEKKNDMWNSFNDISRSLQIGRNKVIAVINELVELGVISKSRVLKKDGSYSDNHYGIADENGQAETEVIAEAEEKEKEESPEQTVTVLLGTFSTVSQFDFKPFVMDCQAKKCDFNYFYTGVVP